MEDKQTSLIAAVAFIALGTYAVAQRGSAPASSQTDSGQADTITQSATTSDTAQTSQPTSTYPQQTSMLSIPAYAPTPTQTATAASDNAPPKPAAASAVTQSDDTPTQILIDHQPVQFSDALPLTIDGQLMVPVQAFADQIGATTDWDDNANSIEIDLPNGQTLDLTEAGPDYGPWDRSAYADSRAFRSQLDSLGPDQVMLIGGHAYMPLDQLAAAFSATDAWDQDNGTVTITLPDVTGG